MTLAARTIPRVPELQRRSFVYLIAALSACVLFASSCEREEPGNAPADLSANQEKRFAVLSPALAEMLRELGGEDLMIARHGYDRFSDQGLPVVGDQSGYNYEALLLADPTHILMEPVVSGRPQRLNELAEREGWMMVELPTLTLENVSVSAGTMKSLIGGEEANERLKAWRSSWDTALTPLDEPHPAPRPIVLMGTDPPAALGRGSVHYQMLQRLGSEPVPTSGGAYQTLALEDLALLEPDTIVLLAPGSEASVEELLGPLDRLDLAPIASGRVVVIRDPMALIPSVSLVRTLEELRAALIDLGPPTLSSEGDGG